MSAVNGANESLKTPAKTKFSSQMKDWLAQGKKLLLDKDISDYDQLVDTKKELDQKLQLKSQQLETTVAELSALRLANTAEIELIQSSTDKRISELVSENKTLFEVFEKRLKSLDIGTNRQKDLEKEVVRLQQELAKANEKAQSSEAKAVRLEEALFENQNTLVATERDLKATKKDLGSRDRELQGTVSQLESTQADLDAQRRELGLENLDLEDLAAKFRDLAAECHSIAKRFFRTQLPQESLSLEFWKVLESSGFLGATPKKFPLSNSNAGQCLRMATAEKIIADKLCNNIFRQYYLPESSPDQAIIDNVLKRLDQSNSSKEAVFRLQLLAAYEPDEQDCISRLVESTIKDVTRVLDPLLFASGARESFQSALRILLDEAVKLWRSVQRSATKGQVLNDPEHRGFNSVQEQAWNANDEYDNAVELPADQMVHIPDQGEPVISLFPQMLVGKNVIFEGFALWSDQNVVVAASIELSQLNSRNSAQSRGVLGRRDSDRRRLSFSGLSSTGRRVEDLSTSPRSPLGNQSFLDHANSRTNSRRMPLSGTRSGELGGNGGGG